MPPIDNDFTTAGFSVKTAYYLAGVAQAAYLSDVAGRGASRGLRLPIPLPAPRRSTTP